MEVKVRPLNTQQESRRLINEHYQNARSAKERGQLLAWCSGVSPTELLTAADIYTVFPENYAADCGARKISTEHCMAAESIGYPQDLCSYARNQLGMDILGDKTKNPLGVLPKPDILLASNNQCSSITKWFAAVSRDLNIPLLLTDVPFMHENINKEVLSTAVHYINEQLEDQISFLEKFTGRRHNFDRLQESMNCTRKAAQLFSEGLAMCRHIPSPMTAFDGFTNIFGIMGLRGSRESVALYQQFKAEIAQRITQNFAAVPNEKHRLYWDNIPIWFKLRDFTTIFGSHNACVVTASYFWNWLSIFLAFDPANPVESMARALMLPFINRGLNYRIDFISKMVEDYSVDGLVMQSSRSCKPYFIGQYDIIRAIEKKTGVPGVMIESDMCDSRFHSDAEVDFRLKAFMELLDSKK